MKAGISLLLSPLLLSPLEGAAVPTHPLEVGTATAGSCTPNSWVDYQLNVTQALADSNLLFEVTHTDAASACVTLSW